MAQQTDAILGQFEEEFEDRNAGVSGPEPEEAGPGVMGKLLTTFTHVKERVSGHGSTPTTPSGVQTQQQHESRVGEEVRGVPHEQSAPDQVHHDAEGVDGVGAGGRVGDGVERSPVGGFSTGGSSRSVEVPASSPRGNGHRHLRDGASPASPKVPRKDLGERIIDKLPGSHANPYSVGHTDPHHVTNPYTEGGDRSAVPTSPSAQRSSGLSSPSLLGKVKNLFTGQKLSRGTATENATSGTAGTTGAQEPGTRGYAQKPTPDRIGDIFIQAKEKFGGHKGPDAGSAETWPEPSKPDISSIPSATGTNAEGQPIEGPTQSKSEDTKKEGLMTKLMDKLHIHEKSSSPKASSPRATTADKGTGTPTATAGTPTATGIPTTDARPSQETGIPHPTEGAPDTTMGTATGPTEN